MADPDRSALGLPLPPSSTRPVEISAHPEHAPSPSTTRVIAGAPTLLPAGSSRRHEQLAIATTEGQGRNSPGGPASRPLQVAIPCSARRMRVRRDSLRVPLSRCKRFLHRPSARARARPVLWPRRGVHDFPVRAHGRWRTRRCRWQRGSSAPLCSSSSRGNPAAPRRRDCARLAAMSLACGPLPT